MTASEGRSGLAVSGLTVKYGGVVANNDVSLRVQPGRVSGLIGPNGAGKTTFVDAVSGFAASTGSVTLDGRRIDNLRPFRRCAAGLTRTWQSGELFSNLTVTENVLVASTPGGLGALVRDVFERRRRSRPERVDRVLELMGLSDRAEVVAGQLPLGQQKLVGVARALAGHCSVVLLDEPAAGLDNDESEELRARLRDVAAAGIGVLLIDHDMSLVVDVCDSVDVMQFGSIIFSGPPKEALSDDAVVEAYLGAPLEASHE
ncbi:ABC transporter ATP-binding protein [Georgenia sp. SYP-B2076]|uniref:ABC transporter ATP-binding protein n=1 Tax=Georgenia sp. SYP-B2076 TaxID=2495881 RepID=UPI000F8E498D|nr:ATP-binding cassette domain-containing protein [Georgenia sp. SYP-B2076]